MSNAVPRFADLPIFNWHNSRIQGPRVQRLTKGIVELSPPHARSMLDIGCGDGTLARELGQRLNITDLTGVDVKVRDQVAIPAQGYDGRSLPFPDGRFDLVVIADVLHHAESPAAVLSEAVRVLAPGGAVIVKDHFRFGALSNATLLAMDMFGNYASGVLVRGTYLSPSEWVNLVAGAGGSIDRLLWPFEIHSLPWRIVTRSEYQFLARIVRLGRS